MTAEEAKNRFGELLESSAVEPVAIEKDGETIRVVLSKAEYDRWAPGGVRAEVARLHEESMRKFGKTYKRLAE